MEDAGGRKRAWPQCRWAAAGPGRAHQRHSTKAPPVWRVPEGETRFAQQTPLPPTPAKKLAQQATKRPFWTMLPTLGEYFRAITIDRSRWANFFAPMQLTAPRDETVDTNAGASGRLHETHDAFAR